MSAAAQLADTCWHREVLLVDVARHLGVRPPSLYNHLNGQEELREELACLGISEMNERLTQASVAVSGPAALRSLAHAYRKFVQQRPGLYWASLRPTTRAEESKQRLLNLLTQILQTLGENRSQTQAIHALRTLRSALHGFCSLELMGGFQMPIDRDASFEIMVEGLITSFEQA